MYGQGVRDGFLVHLYLVRIVDDDVELSESSIVDHERCRLLHAVVDVMMSVHVGDGLSVTRVPQQLHGVCDDGLVRVDVSLTSCLGHCIAEPPEARDRIVLNDLIHVRHLETVVHIPSQQRRGEQNLIASVTFDQTKHGSGAHAAQDLLRRHHPSCVTSQHPDTFSRQDLVSSLSTRIPTTRRP